MKKSDLSTKSRKLIYRVVMFACIAAFFSSIYAVWYLSGTVQRKIALADEQVIAYCPSLGSQTWLIFVIL